MPDFTIEIFYHCESAEHFIKEIVGSKGDKYIVKYGYSHDGPYEYDYSCTCMAFKTKKGHCKHIKQVKSEHCNWNQFIDNNEVIHKDGETFCPKCGRKAIPQRYAI